jgi:3'(2'), 5'-bisphosphate nucleotidase
MTDYSTEIRVACAAAEQAGNVLERFYEEGDVEEKRKEDDSPVTVADLEANRTLLEVLCRECPDDAILSEESTDDLERLERERVWIVDPLDGTRDFIARTGDFAVLVGLAVHGEPVVGAVYRPTDHTLWYAARGAGAWRRTAEGEQRLRVSSRSDFADLRVGVTRLAMHDNLQRALADTGLAANTTQIGACIKMMAVASGEIDVSLCLHGREKEWDTCAPEVIVREAGGMVSDIDGIPFRYNKDDVYHRRGILMSNGHAHEELYTILGHYFEE